jgi:hypothetical protein
VEDDDKFLACEDRDFSKFIECLSLSNVTGKQNVIILVHRDCSFMQDRKM